MEVITKSAKETFELGHKVGASLKGGEILAFVGGLGAGKTTFIQGLAKGLNINSKIPSPTFILMRKYKIGEEAKSFYHLDLYRLEGDIKKEVENLGLLDIWKDKNNVVAIEWAEKIEDIIPKEAKWIRMENINEDERKITIE